MNNLYRIITIFITILFLVTDSVTAQESYYDLSSINKSQHLANEATIIEDPNNELSLDDILKEKYHFEKNDISAEIPYLDFTKSTFWIELQVENPSSEELNFYIETARPLTNEIVLYVLDEDENIIEETITGDDYPFESRMLENRKFLFDIHFSPNKKYKLLFKIKSDGEIVRLPIHFWSIDSFSQFTAKENFFLGFYYGLFFLVIILFSLFGLSLGQRIYLYFVSYVLALALFQLSLDGFSFQYLWRDSSWMANHAILMFAALSMIGMMLYVLKFIGFDDSLRNYKRGYFFLLSLLIFSLLISLTEGVLYAFCFPFLNYLSFLCILYILIGLIIKSKREQRIEIPILFAFIALAISSVIFILSNINAIENEFLANNSLKIGSATEVIFLSIAMVGRYRRTQLEKIEAQEEAFKRLEEINQLKNEQTEKLEKQVKERTQEISDKNLILSQQNKEIINSITYAQRLQQAILPTPQELTQELIEAEVFFRPKDIVSGDFYWIQSTKEKVYFAVADCTGHGVPGAMVSVLGNNSLNRCIKEYHLNDSAKILDNLTDMITEAFSSKAISVSDGMDIALCVWDRKDKLEFSGAFNPLYLLRNNEIIEFKGDKQPIGKFENRKAFTKHEIELQKGDQVYLFSDGYADQFGGPRAKKLKYSNFKKYLIETSSLEISNSIEELETKFDKWKGKEEQIDDVCLLQVRFNNID